MEEYVHGVKIKNIKEISGYGGSPDRAYFNIIYKDGSKEKMTIITKDNTSYQLVRSIQRDILIAFNEYNNIPETYLLKNEVHIRVKGEWIHFGTKCENNLQENEYLTLKEIDELRKQFKIRDEGWRQLAAITLFSIENNKIDRKVPKRYIEQLEYMGYDVDKLEYELKEE